MATNKVAYFTTMAITVQALARFTKCITQLIYVTAQRGQFPLTITTRVLAAFSQAYLAAFKVMLITDITHLTTTNGQTFRKFQM